MNALRNQQSPLRPRPNGFIVVAVLWIISALATFAVIYATYIANVARGISIDDDRLQSESLLSAALELTAYELTATKKDAIPTHGQFSFHSGRASVTVQFVSEAARIDLNQAPKELLAGLFGVLGAAPEQAKGYAENVAAWRTPPQGSGREIAQYLAAGLNYAPRGGPFAHVDELLLVRGLPRELGERALPFVTVFSGLSGVNVLEAAPEVVAALPHMTDDKLNALLRQREGLTTDVRSGSASLGAAQIGVSTEASKAARIDAHIQFENGRHVRSEAVILAVDDDVVPYRVLSWHDGFDDPTGDLQRAVIGQ